jgi:hypothetical protein
VAEDAPAVTKGSERFFFEKKNQKTFDSAGVGNDVVNALSAKFFCVFLFTKRSAYRGLCAA